MTDVEMGWSFGVCAFAVQLTVLIPNVEMMNFSQFLNVSCICSFCVTKALINDMFLMGSEISH